MKRIGDKPMTAAERQRRYRERHADRVKASQQKWLAENPERRKEVVQAHYQRNKASENARAVAWRKANPDRIKEHRRGWHQRHREANIARMAARRAKAREYVVSDRDLRRIMAQPCAHCGSGERLHLDHIVPLARGGQHAVGNLQMLCQRCNQSKGKKVMTEWRAWLAQAA